MQLLVLISFLPYGQIRISPSFWPNIFKFGLDINKINKMNKFHEDWMKLMASRMLTSKLLMGPNVRQTKTVITMTHLEHFVLGRVKKSLHTRLLWWTRESLVLVMQLNAFVDPWSAVSEQPSLCSQTLSCH